MRWDSSSASRGFKWHVMWSDGPTVAGMTALVDRLLPAASALDRTALVYLRTVQPISVALAIVRNLRSTCRHWASTAAPGHSRTT